MTEAKQAEQVAALLLENQDLRRQVEELREAIAALLAPEPVGDKDRLWREAHPRSRNILASTR